MKDLIEKVLNKYNVKHHDLSTRTLAELIVAHMTVGVDGKKGWYWDCSTYDGQDTKTEKFIKKYEDFSIR